MIRIYYTVFNEQLTDQYFSKYLNSLPEKIQKDILKYKRWQDQHTGLFGKLLLKKALFDISDSLTLDQVRYTNFGRPYLDSLDFNISHTFGCVMCAITQNGRVGVDVEWLEKTDLSHFRNCFSVKEWTVITSDINPVDKFFQFWTKKESVIKADGKGLSVPLSDFEVIEDFVKLDNTQWKIAELLINENYKAHITYNINQEIEMIYMDFVSL